MRNLLAFLLIVLAVVPFLGVAQIEYTTPVSYLYLGDFRDNMAAHSPKVACSTTNNDICVVVFYFSGDAFDPVPSLVVKWTWDGFRTNPSSYTYSKAPVTVDYETSGINQNVSANYTEYGLPFGITFYNNEFWVVFDSGGNGGNYAYTFSPYTTTWALEWSNLNDNIGVLDIVDKETDSPLVFFLQHGDTTLKYGYSGFFYLANGSVQYTTFPTVLYAWDCGNTGFNSIDVRGFVAKNGPYVAYDVDARIACFGYLGGMFHSDAGFPKTNMTFTKPHTAFWYYKGGRLFYELSNFTSLSGDIYYIETTDFSTYNLPVLYYSFNYTGVDKPQFINYTTIDGGNTAKSTFVYKAEKNWGGGAIGLFAEQLPLRHFRVLFPSALSLNNLTKTYINVTAILSCNTFTYSQTQTGNLLEFYTPCDSNTVTLLAAGYYPPMSTFNITFSDTCPTIGVSVDGNYLSPYDFTIRVSDYLTGQRVDGALVTVDGESNTTDSEGVTTISGFFPVESTNFTVYQVGCTYDAVFNGIPKIVTVEATKANYESYSASEMFANPPFGSPEDSFDTEYSFEMSPPSTRVNVRAITTDNVEINVESADVNVYGANITYLVQNGVYYVQSYSDTIPSEFVLVDNRSSYSVNVTLSYCGENYQQNITVSTGATQDAIFNLASLSTNLCCQSANDCPDSFCDDKYYRRFDGCVSSKCSFTTSVCDSGSLCDDSRGCFDAQGVTSCLTDDNCINESSCLSTRTSRTGVCGSNGFCIFKDMTCTSGCNSTSGLCPEALDCINGNYAESFLIQLNPVAVLTAEIFRCSLANRGERHCIKGATISRAADMTYLRTFPTTWSSTTNTTSMVFYDVLAVCDDLCNVTVSYCQYGCDEELGQCLYAPASTEGAVKGIFDILANWWFLFFPTAPMQTMAYMVICLAISSGLTYFVGKNGSGNNGLVFIGSTIALSLAGILLQVVPIFVGVIYAVVAGFLVMKMWRGV